jgi:sarcosine oxidase
MTDADVVVIGGGVMGSSAAWHLASRGLDVILLERSAPGHTEGASHGSARIFRLAYPDAFSVGLAARALPLWRRLEQESGRHVLTLAGALDHGPPDVVAELQARLVEGGHAVETLHPGAAAERWPDLRFDTSVLFHPASGRVHADHAVLAFQEAAAAQGASIRHHTRVAKILRHGPERVEILTADGASLTASAAVLAVGGWSPGLAAATVAGIPPLRVTREQPVHFPAADALAWPSFIHHAGAGYIADHDVYGSGSVDGVKAGLHGVGPVVDPDDPDRAIDPAAVRRLQQYAERWLPGVDATEPTASTCLYTTTPDHGFVVDRQGPVTVMAGFSGHGFKFAPVLGALAADLVAGLPGARQFALRRLDV